MAMLLDTIANLYGITLYLKKRPPASLQLKMPLVTAKGGIFLGKDDRQSQELIKRIPAAAAPWSRHQFPALLGCCEDLQALHRITQILSILH